jgi:hypothetical protein
MEMKTSRQMKKGAVTGLLTRLLEKRRGRREKKGGV